MTVANSSIIAGPFVGNDSVDTFEYPFPITNPGELVVYEENSAGTVTELTVWTDYTVDGIDGSGGTITRVAGVLPTGSVLWIRSDIPTTQPTAFNSQGGFFPTVHESAIDRLTWLLAQVRDRADRSFRFADTYRGTLNPVVAKPEAGKALKWNADATALVNSDSDIDTAIADAAASAAAALVSEQAAYASQVDALDSANAATGAAGAAGAAAGESFTNANNAAASASAASDSADAAAASASAASDSADAAAASALAKKGIVGQYATMTVICNPTSAVVVSEDLVVSDLTGNTLVVQLNGTLTKGAGGLSGIDTGTVTADTMYYLWAVSNAAGAAYPMFSLSSTAIGLSVPAGYDYRALLGAVPTDGAGNWHVFQQHGNAVRFDPPIPLIATDAYTTGAWNAHAVGNKLPVNMAQIADLRLGGLGGAQGISLNSDGSTGIYSIGTPYTSAPMIDGFTMHRVDQLNFNVAGHSTIYVYSDTTSMYLHLMGLTLARIS